MSNIDLADPYFGQPGRIDVLLGVDVFVQVVRNGRRAGPPGSPVAFETGFGWVLAGEVKPSVPCYHISSHHVALTICFGDSGKSSNDLMVNLSGSRRRNLYLSTSKIITSVTAMGDSWFLYHEEKTLKPLVNRDRKLFVVSIT